MSSSGESSGVESLPIHDWPEDIAPAEMSMDLLDVTAIYADPRSSRRLRQRRANDFWAASMTFRNLDRIKRKQLAAFFARIEGPIGRFRLFDFSDQAPDGGARSIALGDGSERIVVAADGVAGDEFVTVEIDGVITAPLFLQGDCFSLPNDRRHLVVEEVEENSGGSGGIVTVVISPPLAEDVFVGDLLTVYRPCDVFTLVSRPTLIRDLARLTSVDLKFVQETRP